MRTMLFLIQCDDAVSATLLDQGGDPIDGYTAISVLTALDYLHMHPETGVELQNLQPSDIPQQ